MRLPLLAFMSVALTVPLGACHTDPTSAAGAAGSLKVAPAKQQPRTELRSNGQEEEEELQMRAPPSTKGMKIDGFLKVPDIPGESATDEGRDVSARPAKSAAGYLKIDGIDGESKDAKHRVLSSDEPASAAGSVKIDGIDGESQDKKH
jgi:hypothetical protein